VRTSALLDDVRLAEEARLDLAAGRHRKRREDLRAAHDFHRIESTASFRAGGCASIGEFGERMGYSASEARMLSRVGRAVRAYPSLRTLVLRGRVTLEAASVLDRVLQDPKVQGSRSRTVWVYWAKTESARRFRLRVRARLEAVRTGEAVHETTVCLTDRGQDDLDRARVVLGDRAKRNVSESEAVEVLADYFLTREDPLRTSPGTRRVGDTRENRSRHVPSDVRRRVMARAGGCCEVPFCDVTHGLELAHITAHRDGGGREVDDLFSGCHGHHVTYDAGWFRVEMADGRPRFHFLHAGMDGTRQAGADDPERRRWPVPPHLRPNPHAARVARWRWSRPPPE